MTDVGGMRPYWSHLTLICLKCGISQRKTAYLQYLKEESVRKPAYVKVRKGASADADVT
jgi:hypothetical protein